jgi:hypothetical protein
MIKALEIKEILATYQKYGWKPEKVLLTKKLQNTFSPTELEDTFGNLPVKTSGVSGIWFSRQSKNKRVAWEIRHLNSNPFALMELIENGLPDSQKEIILRQAETRLEEYASNKLSNKDH